MEGIIDVMVISATLKRLLITFANKLMVDCPNIKDLNLEAIGAIVKCNIPRMVKLNLTSDRLCFLITYEVFANCMY